MDGQKKQKVLIAALAVVVLGAGGVWFVARDSGNSSGVAVTVGKSERKQRADRPKTERKAGRKERKTTERKAKAPTKRKERGERKATVTRRKSRKRGDRKSIKKEELKPAA